MNEEDSVLQPAALRSINLPSLKFVIIIVNVISIMNGYSSRHESRCTAVDCRGIIPYIGIQFEISLTNHDVICFCR